MRRRVASWVALSSLCLGCSGTITVPGEQANPGATGGGAPDPASGGSTSGTGGKAGGSTGGASGSSGATAGAAGAAPVACETTGAPPPSRVRRLTKRSIESSVARFVDEAAVDELEALPADSPAGTAFSTSAELVVSDSFANALNLAAESIAARFRESVTPGAYGDACFASEAEALGCAGELVRGLGAKLYHRALADAEVEELLAVYEAGRELGAANDPGDRFASGASWVVRAMLQAASFLYLTELGEGRSAGSETRLSAEETANALAYALLESPPDDELLAAAGADALASPEGRTEEALRLIAAHPDQWKGTMRRFVPEWLGINFGKVEWMKDSDALPLFSSDMRDALETETRLLLEDWAMAADGPRVDVLLSGRTAFVNEVNAPLYGLSASGDSFRKVSLNPVERAGILTLGGFLGSTAHAAQTSPVLRGKVIMQKLLCTDPEPPPPDVPPLPAVSRDAPTTTRARFEIHLADPACRGCHSAFDPMGDAFEMYDALGSYRTEENGFPIDSSGALVDGDGTQQPVENAVELAELLARDPRVFSCVSRQVHRFLLGRLETEHDRCTLERAARALEAGKTDLRDVLSAIVSSDSFVVRSTP